jgi:hypothetical protein
MTQFDPAGVAMQTVVVDLHHRALSPVIDAMATVEADVRSGDGGSCNAE